MTLLRGYLIVGWVLLIGITGWAVATLGLDGANVFLSDYAHAWRAQFYTDFLLHVAPITAWVYWRESSKLTGLLCALGTLMGGVFTLVYLLVATYRAGGVPRRLLLGHHA
ncbi:MAG: hypothetical protein WC809_09020 [Sinimarinibacterium sp.]|jgi:peptidoglycan biosynthesis protein MviN/MurJ (putative lipid II flippase)